MKRQSPYFEAAHLQTPIRRPLSTPPEAPGAPRKAKKCEKGGKEKKKANPVATSSAAAASDAPIAAAAAPSAPPREEEMASIIKDPVMAHYQARRGEGAAAAPPAVTQKEDLTAFLLRNKKRYVFIEPRNEYKYLSTSPDLLRPQEKYFYQAENRGAWSETEIMGFLCDILLYSPLQAETVIDLSRQIFRLVRRITLELASHASSLSTVLELEAEMKTLLVDLKLKLDTLYIAEEEPVNNLIFFVVPGQKPRFIAADMPPWYTHGEKRCCAITRFCPPHQPMRRTMYWLAHRGYEIHHPQYRPYDYAPANVFPDEPRPTPWDEIYTAFMTRFWDLEKIFSIAEFF